MKVKVVNVWPRTYWVNVLVAHSADEHEPIVREMNPTPWNLLGHAEFGLRDSLPYTDHLMIWTGALHRANGGYLILQVRDLFRQSLAVTESVNQRGEIQAVGGVTAKIEGFFRVCQQRGLAGEEGVLIPRASVCNLMLREEVVVAVRKGNTQIGNSKSVFCSIVSGICHVMAASS